MSLLEVSSVILGSLLLLFVILRELLGCYFFFLNTLLEFLSRALIFLFLTLLFVLMVFTHGYCDKSPCTSEDNGRAGAATPCGKCSPEKTTAPFGEPWEWAAPRFCACAVS